MNRPDSWRARFSIRPVVFSCKSLVPKDASLPAFQTRVKCGRVWSIVIAGHAVCRNLPDCLRENPVWPISVDLNSDKCFCFGLWLYTRNNVACQKVLLKYLRWGFYSHANSVLRIEVWQILGHVNVTVARGSSSVFGMGLNFSRGLAKFYSRIKFVSTDAKIDGGKLPPAGAKSHFVQIRAPNSVLLHCSGHTCLQCQWECCIWRPKLHSLLVGVDQPLILPCLKYGTSNFSQDFRWRSFVAPE